jgi:hypothetical protein
MSPTVLIGEDGLIDASGSPKIVRHPDVHALTCNERQLLKTFADALISPRA